MPPMEWLFAWSIPTYAAAIALQLKWQAKWSFWASMALLAIVVLLGAALYLETLDYGDQYFDPEGVLVVTSVVHGLFGLWSARRARHGLFFFDLLRDLAAMVRR